MNKFSIRTDLAIETTELLIKNAKKAEKEEKIDGVEINVEKSERDDITVTWVKITNEEGEKSMGKPIGNYVTIESPAMKENDAEAHEHIIKILSQNLIKLRNIDENSVILVVGLGNWNVTPDALGPQVVSRILVTRHIAHSLPEEINDSVRAVAAISPGVMGITGIETGEIIKGIAKSMKPDLIIAVDALAARRSGRINSAIQMADTGVIPGSGVGNKRMALNEQTLGVPVIAVGVPTVVDAATLVNDTMDMMLGAMMSESKNGGEFYEMLSELHEEDKYNLITQILNPYVGNMFVTPKEVDAVIKRLANIIANSINIALHPAIQIDDINRYMN